MKLEELLLLEQVVNILPPMERVWKLKNGNLVIATDQQLKEVLSHELFIKRYPVSHGKFVKNYFKDNSVLMNKWLRYAENIRSL